MKKSTKRSYRWAVIDSNGNVVRDVVSHRQAVYATRATALSRDNGEFTPAGLRVKRISVSA